MLAPFIQRLVAKYPQLLKAHTSMKIENEPWMSLCVENIGPGITGRPSLSLCHYGKLNGDAMRDPEMIFELEVNNGQVISVDPAYFRNDYVGIEHELTDYRSPLYNSLVQMAVTWNKNLIEQGFLLKEAVFNE
jgi:hypothetical protein